MVVFSSFSISNIQFFTLSVMKLMARPRWPNQPPRPILCKYVLEYSGKSKLMTTFTVGMSIPRVIRSEDTRHLDSPVLKSWKTLFLLDCFIFEWMKKHE